MKPSSNQRRLTTTTTAVLVIIIIILVLIGALLIAWSFGIDNNDDDDDGSWAQDQRQGVDDETQRAQIEQQGSRAPRRRTKRQQSQYLRVTARYAFQRPVCEMNTIYKKMSEDVLRRDFKLFLLQETFGEDVGLWAYDYVGMKYLVGPILDPLKLMLEGLASLFDDVQNIICYDVPPA